SRRQLAVISVSDASISLPYSATVATSRDAKSRSSGSMARSSNTWVAMRRNCSSPRKSAAYSACNARARPRVSTRSSLRVADLYPRVVRSPRRGTSGSWVGPSQKASSRRSAMLQVLVAEIVGERLVEQIEQLECCARGILTLVAMRTARASQCLLQCVGGEHVKCHWHFEIARCVHEASRCFTGNNVEMGCFAAYHCAYGNNSIVPFHRENSAHRNRQLPCARHPHHVDVIEQHAVRDKRLHGAFCQRH